MSNESEQFKQLRKFFYVSENIIPDQGAKKALVDATGNASNEIQVIQKLIDVPDTVGKSIELLKNLVPNNDPGKKQDKDNSGDFKKYFAITNKKNSTSFAPQSIVKIDGVKVEKTGTPAPAKNKQTYKTPYFVLFAAENKVGPTITQTASSEIFMNAFNSIELSKLSPYFNVKFTLNERVENLISTRDNLPQTPFGIVDGGQVSPFVKQLEKRLDELKKHEKILDFVLMHEDNMKKIETAAIDLEATKTKIKNTKTKINAGFGKINTGFGMETFLTPQTLVPDIFDTKIGGSSARGGLMKPFSSYMSISSFTFEVVHGVDTTSDYGRIGLGFNVKDIKLSLILHDKSRLKDVLGLFSETANPFRIGPSSKNNIEIQYGYMHMDEFDNKTYIKSPYAQLIKRSRQLGNFKIKSTDYSIDPSGQVSINLTLMPNVGFEDLGELSIAQSELDRASGYSTFKEEIEDIEKLINEINKKSPADQKTLNLDFNVNAIIRDLKQNRNLSFWDMQQGAILTYFKKIKKQLNSKSQKKQSKKNVSDNVFKGLQRLLTFYEKQTRFDGKDEGIVVKQTRDDFKKIQSAITFLYSNEDLYKTIIDKKQFNVFVKPLKKGKTSENISKAQKGLTERTLDNLEKKNKTSKQKNEEITTLDVMQEQINKNIINSLDGDQETTFVSLANAIQKIFITEFCALKEGTKNSQNVGGGRTGKNSNSYQFEQLQVYFFGFNKNAGYMSSKHIGGFLIDNIVLKNRIYHKMFISKKNKISIKDFLQIINETFVNDPDYIMYKDPTNDNVTKWLTRYSSSSIDIKTGRLVEDDKKNKKNKKNNKNKKTNPTFEVPQLMYDIDSVETKDGKKILRLIISDAKASAHTEKKEMIRAVFDETFMGQREYQIKTTRRLEDIYRDAYDKFHVNVKSKLSDKSSVELLFNTGNVKKLENFHDSGAAISNKYKTRLDAFKKLQKALKSGIVGKENKNNYFSNLKLLFKAIMPSINVYGESSIIQDIKFNLAIDKDVQDANMSAELRKNHKSNSGTSNRAIGKDEITGYPRILSAGKVDITMLGNFYIRAGQEYFIDLETGTELDNIYRISKVNHNIDKGSIKTTISATRQDNKFTLFDELIKTDPLSIHAINDEAEAAARRQIQKEAKEQLRKAQAAENRRKAAEAAEASRDEIGQIVDRRARLENRIKTLDRQLTRLYGMKGDAAKNGDKKEEKKIQEEINNVETLLARFKRNLKKDQRRATELEENLKGRQDSKKKQNKKSPPQGKAAAAENEITNEIIQG
jgi:hypothetical protein